MPSLEIKISTNVRYLSHKKHSFYFFYLSIDFIFILKFTNQLMTHLSKRQISISNLRAILVKTYLLHNQAN